jgi:hypothetical protein
MAVPKRHRTALAALALLAGLAACKSSKGTPPTSPTDAASSMPGVDGPGAQPTDGPPAAQATSDAGFSAAKLDVVFVVGSWESMPGKQKALADALPALFAALAGSDGRLPDLRVGVTSADLGAVAAMGHTNVPAGCERFLGDFGRFLAPSSCGLMSGSYAFANGTATNAPKGLAATTACLVSLGGAGCPYAQPLQAAIGALDPQANPDFLRPQADLLIVIASDSDDCSTRPADPFLEGSIEGQLARFRCATEGHYCGMNIMPKAQEFPLSSCRAMPDGALQHARTIQEMVDSIKARKSGAATVFVAAVTGWPTDSAAAKYRVGQVARDGMSYFSVDPVCTGASGPSYPALRLKALVDAFGANGILSSSCDADWAPALAKVGSRVRAHLAP